MIRIGILGNLADPDAPRLRRVARLLTTQPGAPQRWHGSPVSTLAAEPFVAREGPGVRVAWGSDVEALAGAVRTLGESTAVVVVCPAGAKGDPTLGEAVQEIAKTAAVGVFECGPETCIEVVVHDGGLIVGPVDGESRFLQTEARPAGPSTGSTGLLGTTGPSRFQLPVTMPARQVTVIDEMEVVRSRAETDEAPKSKPSGKTKTKTSAPR